MSKKYIGSCHCGGIKFEAEADMSKGVGICNCSICYKLNLIGCSAAPSSFKLVQGKEKLQDYQFGPKNMHHWFCKSCGLHPFIDGRGPDGKNMLIINVHCLDNINLSGTKTTMYDGKSDSWAVLKTGTL